MDELTLEREGDEEVLVVDDFVRKLYSLLEDESMSAIMCWGPNGNFFTFNDVSAFSAHVLPGVFKYASFNSFVRQLNKYDFHKMKFDDDDSLNANSWRFRHHAFRRGDLKALESIRRKVPGSRKSSRPADADGPPALSVVQGVQEEIERMAQQQDELYTQLERMESDYAAVLVGMADLQRSFVQRQETIQHLMQYALQLGNRGAAPRQ